VPFDMSQGAGRAHEIMVGFVLNNWYCGVFEWCGVDVP